MLLDMPEQLKPPEFKEAYILSCFKDFLKAYREPVQRGNLLRKSIEVQVALGRPCSTHYRMVFKQKAVNKVIKLINSIISEFDSDNPSDALSIRDVSDLLSMVGFKYNTPKD